MKVVMIFVAICLTLASASYNTGYNNQRYYGYNGVGGRRNFIGGNFNGVGYQGGYNSRVHSRGPARSYGYGM